MATSEATLTCPHCGQTVDAAEPSCPACGHLHTDQQNCDKHPDRTARGVCVICGTPLCEDCDRASGGRHFACEVHQAVPVIEGWAQVYTTSDRMEADLIRDNLQESGIDSEVLDQKDTMFNVDLGDLSPVRVLVPAFAWREALPVLRAHMDQRGEVAFACVACGEPFDAGETTCGACGSPLPAAPDGSARGEGNE